MLMALIASSPKSPRSSLVSLRSVMSLLVSPKMLLQWVVNSGELGVMILEFASSSFGSALIRKSLKWLSRHLVSTKCLSRSLSPMLTIESLSVSVGGTG